MRTALWHACNHGAHAKCPYPVPLSFFTFLQGPVQSGRVEVQGLRVETRFIAGG